MTTNGAIICPSADRPSRLQRAIPRTTRVATRRDARPLTGRLKYDVLGSAIATATVGRAAVRVGRRCRHSRLPAERLPGRAGAVPGRVDVALGQ